MRPYLADAGGTMKMQFPRKTFWPPAGWEGRQEPGQGQTATGRGLPRAYDRPLYEQKCSALFEHIFKSYPERDSGIYAIG